MPCCSNKKTKSSIAQPMGDFKVKKSHMKHPTHMPDKVQIICKRAGTTDPRDLQKY